MALTATLQVIAGGELTRALDQGTAKFPFTLTDILSLTDGTGANQADRVFSDQRTLSASANEDLDFAGSLTDAYGQTITMAKLKALVVKASPNNTNDVQLTRPSSNGLPMFL